ncbi:MAG: methyltransferase domain-containing protein [Cyanobacteriota bacterium]|nr:methyltransferase domain-containing protein [Cyanobacteriota bacterium]
MLNSVKSIARKFIPESYKTTLWDNYQRYRRLNKDIGQEIKAISRGFRYMGNQVICPCCNGKFSEFLPYGNNRPNALCPRCSSLERHRLLWLYFQEKTNLFASPLKILHIAPEKFFQKKLKSLPNLDYLSTDLEAEWAMEKMDITNIKYVDNTFDVILCNHVLEHIPDDRKAMKELLRVLKPNGWAILQVPLEPNLDKTFEDPSITSPEDRKRVFGQKDHVRLYGKDYKNRLEEAEFDVVVDNFVKELNEETVNRYGLRRDHNIYFCSKK